MENKSETGWIIYEEVGISILDQVPLVSIEKPELMTDEEWADFCAEIEKKSLENDSENAT